MEIPSIMLFHPNWISVQKGRRRREGKERDPLVTDLGGQPGTKITTMDHPLPHQLQRRFRTVEFINRGCPNHDSQCSLFCAVHAFSVNAGERVQRLGNLRRGRGGGETSVPPETGASTIPAPVASIA